jgi:glycosyltransferase involved in cell wall biosynthesis
VTVVANGLDTRIFKPAEKAAARDLLNLPQDKTLILFGAMYASRDKNKGYAQLRAALDALGLPPTDVELVVFGMSGASPDEAPLPYKTHWLGVLRDQQTLAALYSAADVMVVPSLQESFGQTASEPMACATPVVAFDTSGLKDVVDHRENGYLARQFEAEDLAEGIRWVLEDATRYRDLSTAARRKAERSFSVDVVAAHYRRRYEKALGGEPAVATASEFATA